MAKQSELSSKLARLFGVAVDDKKTFVTHANITGGVGGKLHVPHDRKEQFLQLMQDYDMKYGARMSFSERAGVNHPRPAFFDCDFSSIDTNHLLMREETYVDITKNVILPALYECFTKDKILKSRIEIVIAFPNKKRPKKRIDEDTILYKFGAHIRCLQKLRNGCVVGGGPYMTVEQFDTLSQLLVYRLSQRYPQLEKSVLNDLLDLSPFENGGMRMLRNQKAKVNCKLHQYGDIDHIDLCEYCRGSGTYIDDSFYEPKVIVSADGSTSSVERWENDYIKMWRETSISIPFKTLDEYNSYIVDDTQKLHFIAPNGYAPTKDIAKTIGEDWKETDPITGFTIKKTKRRKLSRSKMVVSRKDNKMVSVLNSDLKDVIESWIHAKFRRFCPCPRASSNELTKYHEDICEFQFSYIHLPNRWQRIANVLGTTAKEVKKYWESLEKVGVSAAFRTNKDNLLSPILIKTDGNTPFSNVCYNAGETSRSKLGYHCSKATAYFVLNKSRKRIVGCQRCHANNKKEESASINQVSCKAFKSALKELPCWIGMGLFETCDPSSIDPLLKDYCNQDKSVVSFQMRNLLRQDGKFRSLRKHFRKQSKSQ